MNIAINALKRTFTGEHRSVTLNARNQISGVTTEAFSFAGHAWPTSARERLLLPEGLREKAMLSLVTEDELNTAREARAGEAGTMSDIVEIDGIRYEVVGVNDRSNHPIVGIRHRTYTLALENPA